MRTHERMEFSCLFFSYSAQHAFRARGVRAAVWVMSSRRIGMQRGSETFLDTAGLNGMLYCNDHYIRADGRSGLALGIVYQ